MHISQNRKTGYSQLYPKEVQGLWVASYFGLAEVIRLLLAKGADCTAMTSYGESALHIASRNGHENVVQLLMAGEKVDIDVQNKRGETELHVAAAGGHVEVVRLLLENDADIEAKTNTGCSALYLASENGHSAVVSLLLQKGADILSEDRDGATALDQASWRGHEGVVQQLLLLMLERSVGRRHFARFKWAMGTYLCKVATRGNQSDCIAVEALLKKGADAEGAFDDHGYTGLCRAAQAGNIEMMKVFLDNGGDVNAGGSSGETPLHHAAKAGQEKVVRLLLERRADVSVRDTFFGHTALTLAAVGGHEAVEQILIANGADPADARATVNPLALWGKDSYLSESDRLKAAMSQGEDGRSSDDLELDAVRKLVEVYGDIDRQSDTGWTALHDAANKGSAVIVEYLLEHQANVNARDNDGIIALHLSCINNHPSTARLLINAGARLEARMERVDGTTDKSGGTPLHWACIVGSASTVALLLEAGANFEARTHWWRTPLHLAARFGHVDAAKLLLAKGADIESRRDTNETPLHFAVEENHYDMVRFLLDEGADMEAQGDRGTPLHMAKRMGHGKVAELLQNASADKK
jgi:ankyrin